MKRTLDGALLTALSDIDLVPAVADPNNYALVHEDDGGFLYLPLYDGVYEVHTVIRPRRPPRAVLRWAGESLGYMFTRTLVETVLTKVPDDNLGAAWLADRCGFAKVGHRHDAWKPGVGLSYWKLDLDGWMKACSTLGTRGRVFHEDLERAKIAVGSKVEPHADDEYHDRAVGAALAMIMVGNTMKGLQVYNRWAVFAGYQPAILVSLQPFVVDIHDAILGFANGEVEVLQCR